MRKMVTTLFMSLDGVIEADDDWQFDYFEDEWFGELTAGWNKAAVVLLGRKSYEGYAALRTEHPDSPVLGFLDGIPKHVVSSTLTDPGWSQTTVIDPVDLPDQVGRLKAGSGGDVLVLGSPRLVRWLLVSELLDELRISVLPIVVGSGARLFDDMPAARVPLELARSEPLSNGVLQLAYRPAGKASGT